ncbi:relaxase/mobilization nuclease domain-containing protein [uncultured Jannaschia sp.]|uniref:relaxase/mobilization nuclease domain-containing protein n=1 Tax=uncultured Jannaschia sp. TaxID=293347 RepID=UPI00262E836F|nr:relaxase/mobilization nuclease domain-containing protein [uncultured Jannaschia sp.]
MLVFDLLKRGRSAPNNISALDAVMGKDWAIVQAGRARRHHEVETGLALKAAHKRNVERMNGGGGGGGGLPGRKPQAVIKMVRKGGASDVHGLRAQMAYLSRDGQQPLERSETLLGAEIDDVQAAEMERLWRMPPEGSGRADRTSHFIASFPENTDPDAAKRAGRAWAEEMFGSGQYGGDSYDYYTAFHTDRAHPHMHVVVYRRGLEHGEWLKVSQRSDMNYDRMREVLVDVAGREGIELEATPRLARGVHDRPVPDAEYRLAGKEGREPVAPAHTQETATLAAAALLHQSRRFAMQAQLVEARSPEASRILYAASAAAAEGKALADITAKISNRQEADMNQRVEAAKAEIRDNIDKIDRGMGQVSDSATRMRMTRDIAALKAKTAPILADARDLAPYTEPSTSGRYRGFDANDPNAAAARTAVEAKVRAVAVRFGTDPEATVERYAGPAPSKGLEQQFDRAEVEERARTRVARGDGPEDVQSRDLALSKMHREIATIYDAVRSREPEASRQDTGRGTTAATEASPQERARQTAAQEESARTAAREANPIYQQVQAEQAAERQAAAQREEAKRQQDRADAERAKRERDANGHGL